MPARNSHCRDPAPRVLLVLGHPRRDSFCAALADAYAHGANDAGVEVRRLALAGMDFEPNVLEPSPRTQTTEPCVRESMQLIAWADHLVFVFPTWWGSMPALLKAFLDRVLMPGFAFEDRDDGEGWNQLLKGKSAHLITTMDTPPLVYRWIYGAPGLMGLGRATLGFCGIAPVRHTIFGPVKGSDEASRRLWMAQAHAAGARLRDGVLTRTQRWLAAAGAWVRALRLQFHPMVWGAFALGTVTALATGSQFSAGAFWSGLAFLYAVEAATVFANELCDYESDRRNANAGPFTGGSRVLVEGLLTRRQLKLGAAAALAIAAVVAIALLPAEPVAAPLMALLVILGVGYTAPPLALSWRGLGEIDVAATHSVLVILLGHVLQGGGIFAGLPWALSLPLFFAVLPSITLSGIPDSSADRAAGKRTLAVIFGPATALRIAQGAAALAAAAAALLLIPEATRAVAIWLLPIALLHASWLIIRIEQRCRRHLRAGRIDGLMARSLSYVLWFVLVPIVVLLNAV